MTFATTSKLWRKYRCHSVCCYGKKHQSKHSTSRGKQMAFCRLVGLNWCLGLASSFPELGFCRHPDTEEILLLWFSYAARHLMENNFANPCFGHACICFRGVIRHKHSLLKHSYCSDDTHPLCRTTCPSSALASSVLATYSTVTFISAETMFTNTDLGEISLNESTNNIYSLKLLSRRYFCF